MAYENIFGIFTHPFLTNIILPFLLIFVIVFALLEKSGVLGKDKRNANLLVALVIGFIFIGAQNLIGFTLTFIPLASVFLVVLLGIFLVFGFIDIEKAKGVKIALGIIFGIALIVAIAWSTGVLGIITSVLTADVIGGILIVVLLGGAIALVLASKGKDNK